MTSQSHFGGNGIITNDGYTQVADGSANTFIFVADRASGVGYSETNRTAFAQDTMTSGAFTFNVGVHYDDQRGETTQVNIAANPFVPSVLPGLTTVAAKSPFTWSNVSPRLGFTYALGAERKTLLVAGAPRYADGLGAVGTTQTQVGGPLTSRTSTPRTPPEPTSTPTRSGPRFPAPRRRRPASSASTGWTRTSKLRPPTKSCSRQSTPCSRSSRSAST